MPGNGHYKTGRIRELSPGWRNTAPDATRSCRKRYRLAAVCLPISQFIIFRRETICCNIDRCCRWGNSPVRPGSDSFSACQLLLPLSLAAKCGHRPGTRIKHPLSTGWIGRWSVRTVEKAMDGDQEIWHQTSNLPRDPMVIPSVNSCKLQTDRLLLELLLAWDQQQLAAQQRARARSARCRHRQRQT